MDRALTAELLGQALGEGAELPSAAELQRQIADAETRLFIAQPDVPEDLISVGWYLHAASSLVGDEVSQDRRAAAFKVSAHILELAAFTSNGDEAGPDLELAFAAQVGYRRGRLDPNARAVLRRVQFQADSTDRWFPDMGVQAAMTLLGLDPPNVWDTLRGFRATLNSVRSRVGAEAFSASYFQATDDLVEASMATMRALRFGDSDDFDLAQDRLSSLLERDRSITPHRDRWVAAMLSGVVDDLAASSLWTVLPDLSQGVKRALTGSSPPVLTLWPPQERLLAPNDGLSPLSPAAKRVVISLPTSAGKTLVAQVLMLDEIARTGRSVCFVAPMRSLVREVRRQTSERLWALGESAIGRNLPDWQAEVFADLLGPPSVDVLTPERLWAVLRSDPATVLSKYSLFVFDEVQFLTDGSRGFGLEGLLTYLHWKTAGSEKRIVLMSAALGDRALVQSWLDPEGDSAGGFSDPWRAPRRLQAVYRVHAENASRRVLPARGRTYSEKAERDLIGTVFLKPSGTDAVVRARIDHPVGIEQKKLFSNGTEDDLNETPKYEQIAPLVIEVEHAGPVLIATGQRDDAQRIAEAVCRLRPDSPGSQALRDVVVAQLGEDHPLVGLSSSGVAFHHARLPPEILVTIEDELREGRLSVVVCTTTLTEGINLPVRTVILAEIPRRGVRRLTGARIVNALGRAGRAGIETEGWVVFVAGDLGEQAAFAGLDPTPEDLTVRSQLATEEALADLAEFEDKAGNAEAAIFEDPPPAVRRFLSFVWFVLAAQEQMEEAPDAETVDAALDATLAFDQLTLQARRRWKRVAAKAVSAYSANDAEERIRWSRSGLSVGSARRLDELASRVAEALEGLPESPGPEDAISVLGKAGAFETLLAFPEAPLDDWKFKSASTKSVFSPPVADVLRDWIGGASTPELAESYLSEVNGQVRRQEQMVNAVAQVFDYYLSWTLAYLVDGANSRAAAGGDGDDVQLPGELALFVRYGVNDPRAVVLLTSGIRSRRLATAIAAAALAQDIETGHLRGWIAGQDPADWPARYGASASDLLELFDFSRNTAAKVLRRLIDGEEITVEIVDPGGYEGQVELGHVDPGNSRSPVALFVPGEVDPLAGVPAEFQSELRNVYIAGVPLAASAAAGTLHLRLDTDAVG